MGKKYQSPVSATIGVLFKEECVLLVRRKNPPDAGKWGFPGGKIEWGETIVDAAVREIFEETNVIAKARKILTAVDCFDFGTHEIPKQHFILIAVLCDWISGEPLAGDDAMETRWFSKAEYSQTDLALSLDVSEVIQLGQSVHASHEPEKYPSS
ncbi:MAG: NUDIX hydrolase [Desulfobulbus oligotrophicus]|jgi:mutator protein MutT|nr:NUDIX hydrolase [Desulfobulbus oligotrophicus]